MHVCFLNTYANHHGPAAHHAVLTQQYHISHAYLPSVYSIYLLYYSLSHTQQDANNQTSI